MKKVCLFVLLFVVSVSNGRSRGHDFALDRAQELYLQVDCKGPHSEPYAMGSAFPFGAHFVFTARHIECPDGQNTLISQNGSMWIEVKDDHNFAHPSLDARV